MRANCCATLTRALSTRLTPHFRPAQMATPPSAGANAAPAAPRRRAPADGSGIPWYLHAFVVAFTVFCYWRSVDDEELGLRANQFGFALLVRYYSIAHYNAAAANGVSVECATLGWWIRVRTNSPDSAAGSPVAAAAAFDAEYSRFDVPTARADMERAALPPPKDILIGRFNVTSVHVTNVNPSPTDRTRPNITLEVIRANRYIRRDKAILYLHGGGYFGGTLDMYRRVAAKLSAGVNATVLLPEYHLAPEHPFPSPVHDALACLTFAQREMRIRTATNVVVGGDSAGGGLTALVLQAIRDNNDLRYNASNLPLPAGGFMISPYSDLTFDYPSMRDNVRTDPIVTRAWLSAMRDTVTNSSQWTDVAAAAKPKRKSKNANANAVNDSNPSATPAARRWLPNDPLYSPAHGAMDGLPPLYLQSITTEVMRDDAVQFAAKARAAGGKNVTSDVLPGLHAQFLFADYLPEGEESMRRLIGWCRKILKSDKPY